MNVYGCVATTTYDVSNLFMALGSIVNYYNTTFIAAGPSGISGQHISRGVISNSGGRINCYGCTFNISNASSINVSALNNSGDGCLRLFNCSFNTHSNVGGTIFDIQTNNHITYVSNCTGSGTAGASLVSGSGITDPSTLAEVTVPSIYALSMNSDASTIASLTSGVANLTNANITNANITNITIANLTTTQISSVGILGLSGTSVNLEGCPTNLNDGSGTGGNVFSFDGGTLANIGYATSAPTLTNAQQLQFWVDESGNALHFVLRYSDGSTTKTGTINLT
jgi:hypothetical protein